MRGVHSRELNDLHFVNALLTMFSASNLQPSQPQTTSGRLPLKRKLDDTGMKPMEPMGMKPMEPMGMKPMEQSPSKLSKSSEQYSQDCSTPMDTDAPFITKDTDASFITRIRNHLDYNFMTPPPPGEEEDIYGLAMLEPLEEQHVSLVKFSNTRNTSMRLD